MPKNKGAGGKSRKRGARSGAESHSRELTTKDEDQLYARMEANLGQSRLAVMCEDGTKRIAVIRGALRRKMWMTPGDILLCSKREFQDDKVDILLRYQPEEVKRLVKEGEVPQSLVVDTRRDGEEGGGTDGVQFVADDNDDDFELDADHYVAGQQEPDWGDEDDEEEEEDSSYQHKPQQKKVVVVDDDDEEVDIDNI